MGDLEGIDEDVPFDWDGADALAAKLRASAGRLEGQVPHREADAREARAAWRGHYAHKFDERVAMCTGDAKAIADAMKDAANKLEELARLAQEEQDRRVKARQWEADQRNTSIFEKATDELGITSKDDDKPPPVDYGEGHRFTAPAHLRAGRD